MWANYGKTFVEYLYLKNLKIMNSHMNIQGEEILNKISKKAINQ